MTIEDDPTIRRPITRYPWLVTVGGEAQASRATVVSRHATRYRALVSRCRENDRLAKIGSPDRAIVEWAESFVRAGGVLP